MASVTGRWIGPPRAAYLRLSSSALTRGDPPGDAFSSRQQVPDWSAVDRRDSSLNPGPARGVDSRPGRSIFDMTARSATRAVAAAGVACHPLLRPRRQSCPVSSSSFPAS